MEKVTIIYNGFTLQVQGIIQGIDESVGIYSEDFEAEEIKHNDLDLFDDYDHEQLEEIEALCLTAIKKGYQADWEAAND
tara:strand:- start:5734 stop:5970 length:237 start_codon:yes stop_codon:yes gene_type:complete